MPHACKNTTMHTEIMTVLDADAQGKQTDKESQFSVGSLTDWLINPEEYEPVVALEHRKTHSS